MFTWYCTFQSIVTNGNGIKLKIRSPTCMWCACDSCGQTFHICHSTTLQYINRSRTQMIYKSTRNKLSEQLGYLHHSNLADCKHVHVHDNLERHFVNFYSHNFMNIQQIYIRRNRNYKFTIVRVALTRSCGYTVAFSSPILEKGAHRSRNAT